MKKILMYMLPDRNRIILSEIEGKEIEYNKDLSESDIKYVNKYYSKLGNDFRKRYDAILKYKSGNAKIPIFFEDISIYFKIEN